MEEKYANKVFVCKSKDMEEVIIEFFREEPVIDPVENKISVSVVSISKLVVSSASAQKIVDALEEILSGGKKE